MPNPSNNRKSKKQSQRQRERRQQRKHTAAANSAMTRAQQPEEGEQLMSAHQHVGLTNTNTDSTCLDINKPIVFRWLYSFNLWTGLYMLNGNERKGFHVFGWIFGLCMTAYVYAFITGFKDGFSQAAAIDDSNNNIMG